MKIDLIKKIDVYFEDNLVGSLYQNDDLSTSFIYSKSWLNNGFSISPFKLPLTNEVFTCNDYLVNNMFGVFLDSLPDSWGNMLIDKYLIKLGYNPSKITLFQRLTLLDNDSLGALEFKPSFKKEVDHKIKQEFDDIKRNIDELIKQDSPISDAFLDIYRKGHSTGGSRPKINYRYDDGLYIVKFKGQYDELDIGEKEYKLNLLASKCGINVPPCKLISSNISKGYFATKRFDRDGTRKIHVISLAGLLDLRVDLSQIHYKGFLQVVNKLCPKDNKEAIRRMIFNYLIDNKDDHPRNFSFIYDLKNHEYRLSPFFDITSTPNIKEHMMQVNNKDNPSIDDFLKDIEVCHISKKEVIEIYNDIKEKVDEYKKENK